MISIGDFATFTHVSVRTLRFYDQQDLLRPAFVDPHSGYRFYEAAQVDDVLRIRALRACGLSLARIREVLRDGGGAEQLQRELARRRIEIQGLQSDLDRQLATVDAHLRLLRGVDMPTYDVATKQAPPIVLATLEDKIDQDAPGAFATAFGRLFAELGAALGAAGVVAGGPAWSLYERSEEDGLRIAAGLPVASAASLPPSVARTELPARDVAYTIHLGGMDGIGAAYEAVLRWVEASGLSVGGGAREVSLVWDQDHPERNVTELQIPVTKA